MYIIYILEVLQKKRSFSVNLRKLAEKCRFDHIY